MYLWRKLNERQREELLEFRRSNARPWHSPLHRESQNGRYLLTAACFEHRHHIGLNPKRLADFLEQLLKVLETGCEEIYAWCVLPNHYHVLVLTRKLPDLLHNIGKLHGRTAFEWNGEENERGRKVWFNCVETGMKSDRHFWATLNYVHHNPVHHGYVQQWQDWPFSSGAAFLEKTGHEQAAKLWKEYPLLDYGKDWDAPDL
jgi:putative transposase